MPSIYYSRTSSGPALVLLHGFPESGTLWQNITGNLSGFATLIIPDLPGAGRSPLQKETGIDQMADEIKAILDKEGIDKAVLAGHSMGGYVALAFAVKYPGAVAGISLVHSTPLADDDEKKITRQKSIDLIRKGGKGVFTSQMIPNLFADSFKQKRPEIVKASVDEGMKMNGDSMINFYKAMMLREDTTGILNNAPYPVQWVIGENDNIIPYKKILQFCYRSDVNFVSLYKNCGHMSMFEMPENLARDLRHFTEYCHTCHLN